MVEVFHLVFNNFVTDALQRVRSFLPQLKSANAEIGSTSAEALNIEHLGAESSSYIQMDLLLLGDESGAISSDQVVDTQTNESPHIVVGHESGAPSPHQVAVNNQTSESPNAKLLITEVQPEAKKPSENDDNVLRTGKNCS